MLGTQVQCDICHSLVIYAGGRENTGSGVILANVVTLTFYSRVPLAK